MAATTLSQSIQHYAHAFVFHSSQLRHHDRLYFMHKQLIVNVWCLKSRHYHDTPRPCHVTLRAKTGKECALQHAIAFHAKECSSCITCYVQRSMCCATCDRRQFCFSCDIFMHRSPAWGTTPFPPSCRSSMWLLYIPSLTDGHRV